MGRLVGGRVNVWTVCSLEGLLVGRVGAWDG